MTMRLPVLLWVKGIMAPRIALQLRFSLDKVIQ